MVEVGLVAGYLIAWAVRKARRAGGRLDAEVDTAVDAGLDRLHEVVAGKLGPDPAVAQLTAEAGAGGDASDRTRRRVEDAVAEAADGDAGFSTALAAALAELARLGADGGPGAAVVMAATVTGRGRVYQAGRDQHIVER